MNLIKATQPFERISLDFKGPLSSISKNTYLLVIVDEFTRFPFAYACSDMKASTVIQKLTDLFSLFGFPNYVHSDQGPSLMSYELKSWLHSMGVPTSKSTRYNPRGNGQVERCNRTVWQTVLLALRTKKLPLTHWEYVLQDALHSIRSLLCTAINCTPHERVFFHSRKSFNGVSLPSWIKPGPVFVKRHNRNKNDLVVEEAELIEANPRYAHVMLNDGREITVSLRDLAPNPESLLGQNHNVEATEKDADDIPSLDHNETSAQTEQNSGDVAVHSSLESHDFDVRSLHEKQNDVPVHETTSRENPPVLRRSSRTRKPIDRYGNNVYY